MTSLLWDDRQQILWVGTFGGGIVKFDISNSTYSRVKQNFESRIGGIVEDDKGYVWLAMSDGGIMKSTAPMLSMDTRFERWTKVSEFSGCYTIYKCRNGYIWLGDKQGKIIFINPVTEKIESFQLQTDARKNMQAAIHCFCQDSRNRLWVGTSEGLIQVEPKSNKCKKQICLPG